MTTQQEDAAYVVYSVNIDDPEDSDHELSDYDNDNDGLNHYSYLAPSGTPGCKQSFAADHTAIGPVVYKYTQEEPKQRVFMYTEK